MIREHDVRPLDTKVATYSIHVLQYEKQTHGQTVSLIFAHPLSLILSTLHITLYFFVVAGNRASSTLCRLSLHFITGVQRCQSQQTSCNYYHST